jgi:hypothetical protein
VAHLLGRALEMPVGEPSVAVRVEDIEPDRLAGMLTEKQRAAVLMMRASDVLTNCDTCRHDYGVDGHRLCAIVANRGDVWNWCRENCTNAGHPKPGATGCPGWAAKENGA